MIINKLHEPRLDGLVRTERAQVTLTQENIVYRLLGTFAADQLNPWCVKRRTEEDLFAVILVNIRPVGQACVDFDLGARPSMFSPKSSMTLTRSVVQQPQVKVDGSLGYSRDGIKAAHISVGDLLFLPDAPADAVFMMACVDVNAIASGPFFLVVIVLFAVCVWKRFRPYFANCMPLVGNQ